MGWQERNNERINKLLERRKENKAQELKDKKRKANTEKKRRYRRNKRKRGITPKMREFLSALEAEGGHLTNTCTAAGVTSKWFYNQMENNSHFRDKYYEYLEHMESEVRDSLYKQATKDDASVYAIREWNNRFNVAYLRLQTKLKLELRHEQQGDTSIDKRERLVSTLNNLDTLYKICVVSGKFNQAIKTQVEITKLLELTEASDMTDFEILTGSKLVKLMEKLNISADAETIDIDYEELDDDIKGLYAEMYPGVEALEPENVEDNGLES